MVGCNGDTIDTHTKYSIMIHVAESKTFPRELARRARRRCRVAIAPASRGPRAKMASVRAPAPRMLRALGSHMLAPKRAAGSPQAGAVPGPADPARAAAGTTSELTLKSFRRRFVHYFHSWLY